jgi:hypothetical protein
MKPASERKAYRVLVQALGKRRGGATIADMSAATALPLERVRELLPHAADEFSGSLAVTESGEILYSFPKGFSSRYRGFRAGLRRCTEKLFAGLALFGAAAFKVWIMVMLIGYFVLFLAIALMSVFVSVAANSRDSGNRRQGGVFFGPGIFDLFIRLWFYSELTRPSRQSGRNFSGRDARPSRPMHKAIFSFVFGEEDPNQGWPAREKKAVIAYIQAHQGLISLPEFMAITGKGRAEAEDLIMSFCVEFGGSPEATEAGTIVYRFDDILLRSDTRSFGDLAPPVKRLKIFSANPKTMNTWFGIINTVNLFFGFYFLFNALNTGVIHTMEQFQASSFLYGFVYGLSAQFISNPLPLITAGLGLVPLAFSLLFWIIPSLRFFHERKENEETKLENLRRLAFSHIWAKPLAVETGDIESPAPECRPQNMAAAQNRVIKDMGVYSVPEVEIQAQGRTVYSFRELEREKAALEQYRAGLEPDRAGIGKIVYNSDS